MRWGACMRELMYYWKETELLILLHNKHFGRVVLSAELHFMFLRVYTYTFIPAFPCYAAKLRAKTKKEDWITILWLIKCLLKYLSILQSVKKKPYWYIRHCKTNIKIRSYKIRPFTCNINLNLLYLSIYHWLHKCLTTIISGILPIIPSNNIKANKMLIRIFRISDTFWLIIHSYHFKKVTSCNFHFYVKSYLKVYMPKIHITIFFCLMHQATE